MAQYQICCRVVLNYSFEVEADNEEAAREKLYNNPDLDRVMSKVYGAVPGSIDIDHEITSVDAKEV